MKLFNGIVGIILFSISSTVLPSTVNGRFSVVNTDSSKLSILVQINTDTGADELGGVTMVFNFDTTAISYTYNPVNNVDYIFHNFSGGNYSQSTITRPMKNKIWINIDLPYINNNNGTLVSGTPDWTDVVTIHFDIVDPDGAESLIWQTTSPFWGIYNADNSTLWETGMFQGYPTSVGPGSELPEHFELSQNYPNPFNPSTKIIVSLPHITIIRLAVYNLIGELVCEVANGEYITGKHEFTFSAAGLASGVYFYRIESSDFIAMKKMVLLR